MSGVIKIVVCVSHCVMSSLLSLEEKMARIISIVLTLSCVSASIRTHYLHWSTDNRDFRSNQQLLVNEETHLGQYDVLQITCPYEEKHIIYNVSKLEFDSCRILQPRHWQVVGFCNGKEYHFTKTFRQFSPIPRGLEFKPGQNYYFVSTSSTNNINNKFGGFCASHNMKVTMKIANTKKSLMSPLPLDMSSSSLSNPPMVSIIFVILVTNCARKHS